MSKTEQPPPSYNEAFQPSGTQYWNPAAQQTSQPGIQSSSQQQVQYGQPGSQPPVQYISQSGQYTAQPGQPGQAPYVGQTVVIVQQPQPVFFGDFPQAVTCQFCHQQITTRIETVSSFMTWLWCFMIVFMGGVLGCCLIPFYCDQCKDVKHYCPHCDKIVGMYKRQEAAQAARLQRQADYLNARSQGY